MQNIKFPSGIKTIQRNRRGPMSRQRRTSNRGLSRSSSSSYTTPTSTHGDEDDTETLIESVLLKSNRNGNGPYQRQRRKDYAPLKGDDLINDDFQQSPHSRGDAAFPSPVSIFEAPLWVWRLACVFFGVLLYMSLVSSDNRRNMFHSSNVNPKEVETLLKGVGKVPLKDSDSVMNKKNKFTFKKSEYASSSFLRDNSNTVVDARFDDNDDMVIDNFKKEQTSLRLRRRNPGAGEYILDNHNGPDVGKGSFMKGGPNHKDRAVDALRHAKDQDTSIVSRGIQGGSSNSKDTLTALTLSNKKVDTAAVGTEDFLNRLRDPMTAKQEVTSSVSQIDAKSARRENATYAGDNLSIAKLEIGLKSRIDTNDTSPIQEISTTYNNDALPYHTLAKNTLPTQETITTDNNDANPTKVDKNKEVEKEVISTSNNVTATKNPIATKQENADTTSKQIVPKTDEEIIIANKGEDGTVLQGENNTKATQMGISDINNTNVMNIQDAITVTTDKNPELAKGEAHPNSSQQLDFKNATPGKDRNSSNATGNDTIRGAQPSSTVASDMTPTNETKSSGKGITNNAAPGMDVKASNASNNATVTNAEAGTSITADTEADRTSQAANINNGNNVNAVNSDANTKVTKTWEMKSASQVSANITASALTRGNTAINATNADKHDADTVPVQGIASTTVPSDHSIAAKSDMETTGQEDTSKDTYHISRSAQNATASSGDKNIVDANKSEATSTTTADNNLAPVKPEVDTISQGSLGNGNAIIQKEMDLASLLGNETNSTGPVFIMSS